MRVRSLVREDPLEKGMATHSSILAWRTVKPGGLQSTGSQRVWNGLATEQQRFAGGDRPSGTPSPLGEASCLRASWSCFTCLPGCAQLMSIPCPTDYSNHLDGGAEAEKSGTGEKLRVMSISCFLYFRANRAWPFGMQPSSLRKKLRLNCEGFLSWCVHSVLCFVFLTLSFGLKTCCLNNYNNNNKNQRF